MVIEQSANLMMLLVQHHWSSDSLQYPMLQLVQLVSAVVPLNRPLHESVIVISTDFASFFVVNRTM